MIKKFFFALAASFGLPLAMFAEDTTPLDSISQAVGTQLTSWSTSITSFFTTNLPTIMGIIGIALGVALLWVVFKLFKKATNKAS